MAFGDIIQRKDGNAGSGTSLAVTFDSTPTSGNLLVAVHMTGATSSTGCSSTSGSYISALAITNSTESDESEIYYRIAGASEATAVTATSSADDEHGLVLLEIEGPWEASPVDLAEAEARDASGTTNVINLAGTTSQADEVGVAAVYTRDNNNGASTTWSDSFASDALSVTASPFKSIAVATRVFTSTLSPQTTHTFTSSAVSQGGMVTFKKEAAGGGGTTGTGIMTLSFAAIAAVGVMQPEGTGALTLANADIAASGLQTLTATAALALANADLAASGTSIEDLTGAAALALANADITASGSSTDGTTGTASLALKVVTLAAAGEEELAGTAALQLFAAVITGAGTHQETATATAVLRLMATIISGTAEDQGLPASVVPDIIRRLVRRLESNLVRELTRTE